MAEGKATAVMSASAELRALSSLVAQVILAHQESVPEPKQLAKLVIRVLCPTEGYALSFTDISVIKRSGSCMGF